MTGLAPLHNPRSPLLKVPVGPAVKIAPSRRWVPELRYPRKEAWRRAQVLELDFSKVDKSGEPRRFLISRSSCATLDRCFDLRNAVAAVMPDVVTQACLLAAQLDQQIYCCEGVALERALKPLQTYFAYRSLPNTTALTMLPLRVSMLSGCHTERVSLHGQSAVRWRG